METDSDTSDFKKEICVLDQYQCYSGIGIILNIHCNPEHIYMSLLHVLSQTYVICRSIELLVPQIIM